MNPVQVQPKLAEPEPHRTAETLVWDLFANRVVPFWVANKWPSPISHAWVSDKEQRDVCTSINGYEWPVPIPKDVDLNHIRIEMLNLGAEYVWLDVLCLRQKGGCREDLCREEWKVDVPTIGAIYCITGFRMVVYYLSGLGRPFFLTSDDLESDHCWFRRAWTLQEVDKDYVIGGETEHHWMDKNMQRRVNKHLQSLKYAKGPWLFDLLQEMWNRVSTKPLDKVAGLAYFISKSSIPIYDELQSEEDAWVALTEVMSEDYCLQLLFLYSEPGDGCGRWQPSWNQLMVMEIIPDDSLILGIGTLGTEETGADWYEGPCIKSGYLWGLGQVSNKEIS
ncbi:uncharacterized protein EV420DRAFT_1733477 [Desarmillaria tabescens]|uniref:Heterokaryon incompatibility domain-containing protein n=1 Tax=Armillaria tabescens TaxID=1929756 RepID=A0AA39JDF3_ARMTA|nr:uncharacterized protein EV420DRAFT_1733477 [Desarmillaria tabescens]KAK0439977.1 hypothetical protein EV420DRAFT_1733477 [Desarmillaria tabescens]